jgi:hypothetical protein
LTSPALPFTDVIADTIALKLLFFFSLIGVSDQYRGRPEDAEILRYDVVCKGHRWLQRQRALEGCNLGSMAWALSIGRGLETPDVPSYRTSANRASAKEWRQRNVA